LQTRHFRGLWRAHFMRVFCMGWRMVALTTLRLARACAYPAKVPTR
jgi:hypothetical protein